MLDVKTLAQEAGKSILFIGTECKNWTVADFGKAARNAAAMGFDTIAPKRADGTIKWYQTPGHLKLERQAALSAGVGYIPFIYCYGPAFNTAQIDGELEVAKEMCDNSGGIVCMDLEVEWNGQVAAAQHLAQGLSGYNGNIILSTWADPIQQDWVGVVKALNPVVAAWGPQEYTNWLSLQEAQLTSEGVPSGKIFPSVDIADLFGGANTPLDIVHAAVTRGHGSVWIWEYTPCMTNPNMARTVTALLGKNAAPAPVNPIKLPSPTHVKKQVWLSYTVGDGESLIGIATKLGITNWFADLFVPNKTTLDAAAQAHGAPNSNNGSLIYAGVVLKYLHLQ